MDSEKGREQTNRTTTAVSALTEADKETQGPEPASRKYGNPGTIFAHQIPSFRRIIATALAFQRENWWSFPVLPRWHVLIVAPTGAGKSHIISSCGKAMGFPVYKVYVTRWIIAGGRGRETWTELAHWLSKQSGKCLIVLDELDKLSTGHTGEWATHLKCEIFALLDRNLPPEIVIEHTDSLLGMDTLWAKAQMTLRCHTLILAAGAFQHLWDHRPKNMGFINGSIPDAIPSEQELKTHLPPELINRFSEILALPPLCEQDYRDMIQRTAQALPSKIRSTFLTRAKLNLHLATREGKGVRYVEEIITQVLVESASKECPGIKLND